MIPDFIIPFVGYRSWWLDVQYLKSFNGVIWTPGKALKAYCNTLVWSSIPNNRHVEVMTWKDHFAPADECTCGIYATKDCDTLLRSGINKQSIRGEVYLWGVMFEGTNGYRAQYAYPKNFVISLDLLGGEFLGEVAEGISRMQLEALSKFNVDMFLTRTWKNPLYSEDGEEPAPVPVYVKDEGWQNAGLRWMEENQLPLE
jgi:hypothetical protein